MGDINQKWYYTQLTGFVARGPRASQCRLYLKTSNQVNLVLLDIWQGYLVLIIFS